MEADGTNGSTGASKPDVNQFATHESRSLGAHRAAEVKRERKNETRNRLADEVAKRFDTILAVFEEGIAATHPPKTIIRKNGDVVEEPEWPDHPTRLKAAAEFLNQGLGKPALALTGPDGRPLGGDAVEQGAERFLALVDGLVERAQRRLDEAHAGQPGALQALPAALPDVADDA